MTRKVRKKGRRKAVGASRRGPRIPPESTAAIIDRLLVELVPTVLNGEPTKITALEAIIYQLLQKETAGDVRASNILAKYEQLAKHSGRGRIEIVFSACGLPDPVAANQPGGTDG